MSDPPNLRATGARRPSERSFFLDTCARLLGELMDARRPGRTADLLREEILSVIDRVQSEDVTVRLTAIEQLVDLESKVKSFIANER